MLWLVAALAMNPPPRIAAQESSDSTASKPTATSKPGGGDADRLPGKIYVWASLEFTTPTDALGTYDGFIVIDPNNGTWKRIPSSGHWLRVSPVDGRLAFQRASGPAKDPTQRDPTDIFVMDAADAQPIKVADNCALATWSPDAKRLLVQVGGTFPKGKGWRGEHWTIDLDTKDREKLPVPQTDQVQDWSPAGNWLVTMSDRHPPFGRGGQLYVMHPDGTEEKRLTEGGGLNANARFSPDGKRIVYLHQERGRDGLWVVDTDGSNVKRVLQVENDGSNDPHSACFSPDGKWLAVHVMAREARTENGRTVWGRPSKPDERIEIVTPDGVRRGAVKLNGVKRIGYVEHPDWK
jgi:dipeptidyl aminopeptidase/acylaminoacyl peptidase